MRPATRYAGIAVALAAGVLAATPGIGHAHDATVAGLASPVIGEGPVSLPSFSSSVTLSTWSWTPTTLCGSNVGDGYGLLRVQQLRPAGSIEYLEIRPGTTHCIERWWSGVDINAMNVSSSPLTVQTS